MCADERAASAHQLARAQQQLDLQLSAEREALAAERAEVAAAAEELSRLKQSKGALAQQVGARLGAGILHSLQQVMSALLNTAGMHLQHE